MTLGETPRYSASSVWDVSKISRHLRIVGPGSFESVLAPAIFSAIRSFIVTAASALGGRRKYPAVTGDGGRRKARAKTKAKDAAVPSPSSSPSPTRWPSSPDTLKRHRPLARIDGRWDRRRPGG